MIGSVLTQFLCSSFTCMTSTPKEGNRSIGCEAWPYSLVFLTLYWPRLCFYWDRRKIWCWFCLWLCILTSLLTSLFFLFLSFIQSPFPSSALSTYCSFWSRVLFLFSSYFQFPLAYLFSVSLLHLWHLICLESPPILFFLSHIFCCVFSVWPRPVHSEHQIRFTGRRHTSPPAAEQRARHPDSLPWKRRLSTRPYLPQPRWPLHLAPPGPAHATNIHSQSQPSRGNRHDADPRTHAQPQPPPAGALNPPSLSHSRGGAIATRYAPLRQPTGSQPYSADRLLQPSQPGLPPRGLSQRIGKAQLSLTAGHARLPENTKPSCAPFVPSCSHPELVFLSPLHRRFEKGCFKISCLKLNGV